MLDATVAELSDRIRAGAGLRIRGHGSKDSYGPARAGAPLSTLSLHGVQSYEPSELVVTVAAGTPLSELETLLGEHGQCLPFEPPRFANQGTVGGMLASGFSGPARASVGSVRDYVLGLQMLNGQGEHLTFGGQVMKNVAGYDVSRLMVGAWGSLGLITQASLKVLPIAPAEATLAFDLPQAQGLELLHRWGGEPLPLNASIWVDGQLRLRLRGAAAAVEAACKKLQGRRSDAAEDWTRCRDRTLPFFSTQPAGMVLWRLSLPQTAPVLELPWPQLIEWHGALRWLWAPPDAALQRAAQDLGGSATLAASATPWDGMAQSAAAIAQRLKTAFDPHGVFNPAPGAVALA